MSQDVDRLHIDDNIYNGLPNSMFLSTCIRSCTNSYNFDTNPLLSICKAVSIHTFHSKAAVLTLTR